MATRRPTTRSQKVAEVVQKDRRWLYANEVPAIDPDLNFFSNEPQYVTDVPPKEEMTITFDQPPFFQSIEQKLVKLEDRLTQNELNTKLTLIPVFTVFIIILLTAFV